MPSHHSRRSRKGDRSPDGYNRDYGPDPIARYYDNVTTPDCPLFTMYTFVKYFRQDWREPPTPLAQLIGRKLAPIPKYQAAGSLPDIRCDLVLPDNAPPTIATIADLIVAFDTILQLERDVMIELKFILRRGAAPHRAFETVRGFALQYIARQRGLAALLVLHLPGKSGSSRDSHIHLFVPARLLTELGFGAGVQGLVHDQGCTEFEAAWQAWRAASQASSS